MQAGFAVGAMELTRNVMQAMYSRGASSEGFSLALKDYYGDLSDMA